MQFIPSNWLCSIPLSSIPLSSIHQCSVHRKASSRWLAIPDRHLTCGARSKFIQNHSPRPICSQAAYRWNGFLPGDMGNDARNDIGNDMGRHFLFKRWMVPQRRDALIESVLPFECFRMALDGLPSNGSSSDGFSSDILPSDGFHSNGPNLCPSTTDDSQRRIEIEIKDNQLLSILAAEWPAMHLLASACLCLHCLCLRPQIELQPVNAFLKCIWPKSAAGQV